MAENRMKFFGTFDTVYEPNSNEIWAFTLGMLTERGWDSDKAANLELLLVEIPRRIKSTTTLIIAVPTYSFKKNFNLFLGREEKNLVIKVWLPELEAFKGSIIFFDVKVAGVSTNGFRDIPGGLYASYDVISLDVANVARTVKH